MKIVQIVTRSDNMGGAQVHVRDLSMELQKYGLEVHVLCGGKGPFLEELRQCGIPVHVIPHLKRAIHPYMDWCAFWEIYRTLKELNPALVGTHTSKAGWLGRLAAWSLDIPVVYTVHGLSFINTASLPGKNFYILAEKIAGLVSSRVITVSESDQEFCLKHHILPFDKITTVHNGIPDLPDCRSDGRTVSAPVKLFMTARLEKPKNHLFLLRVLGQLTQRDDWELDLVGDGPLRAEVEEVIIKLNLFSRVHVLGARNDVPKLLKQADIFMLISDWEGLPLSILEAMRAGLPVIASDVGGVKEAVEDDVNGFLIPKGDAGLLKDRLIALLSSEELRLRMGKASRKKFQRGFTISQMVEKTISVYNSAIARKSPSLNKIN